MGSDNDKTATKLRQNWDKTEKDRKNMEKENNTDERHFSESEIPDLISLKPFELEPKTKHRRYWQ